MVSFTVSCVDLNSEGGKLRFNKYWFKPKSFGYGAMSKESLVEYGKRCVYFVEVKNGKNTEKLH